MGAELLENEAGLSGAQVEELARQVVRVEQCRSYARRKAVLDETSHISRVREIPCARLALQHLHVVDLPRGGSGERRGRWVGGALRLPHLPFAMANVWTIAPER